ncbi:MAG: OmpA family protein [Gemmatimonadetes bacterium]|nr:OmpA family protein [Gemmatimonadota bacterium]
MIRRTMTRGLLALLVVAASPVPVEGQIPRPGRVLNDARDQIRNDLERMIGDAVACAFNDEECIEEAKENGDEVVIVDDDGNVITDKDGNPVSDPNAAARAIEEPGTGRWSNYDYLRGEVPMFNTWWNIPDVENRSEEEMDLPPRMIPNPDVRVGRIPGNIKFGIGNMEFVHLDGVGALSMIGRSVFQVILDEELSAERGFSLEVTLLTGGNYGLQVYFEPRIEAAGAERKFGEDRNKHFIELSRTAQISYAYNAGTGQSSTSGIPAHEEFTTFEFQISDGGYALMYVNGDRVAQIPNFILPEGSNTIEFFAQAPERTPLYISDIRVDYGITDPVEVLEAFDAPEPEPYVTRSIFFDFNSDQIRPESTPELERIRQMLDAYEGTVVIEGHTDGIGSDDYNLELSQRRADAVKAYLVNLGIAPEKMQTLGKGESEPIADNDTPEGQQQNRRVVVAPTM